MCIDILDLRLPDHRDEFGQSYQAVPSVFSQKSFQSLHNIVQHCARLCNCCKLTSWQPNQLCIESYKFTLYSLATQAAFILGNFVHLYRAYLHFLNISEQYSFRDTSCTKRFNFRKSLKKPQKVSNLARKMWFCWCMPRWNIQTGAFRPKLTKNTTRSI